MNLLIVALFISLAAPNVYGETVLFDPGVLVQAESPKDEKTCGTPKINKIVEAFENDSFTEGDTVEVACEDGYRFSHFKSHQIQLECQYDGSWLDILTHQHLPACERIGSCPLPLTEFGEVLTKPGGYMPGDIAPVKCDVSKSFNIVCQKDGSWKTTEGDNEINSCEVETKNCSLPPVEEHRGYHLFTSDVSNGIVQENTKALFFCTEGFTLAERTELLMTCVNGIWEGIDPKCVPKKNDSVCLKPESVPNASYSLYGDSSLTQGGTFPEGTTVVYICDGGYKLFGESRRMCIDFKWTGFPPTCIPGCASPPTIVHAGFNFFGQHTDTKGDGYSNRIVEGSSVYYFCENGYRMQSKSMSSLKCSEGQWQGNFPVCEKRTECDMPMDIPNGNWIIESSYADFRIGSRVQYECDKDYKAIGLQHIECLETGYWSDYAPKCLPADQYCEEPDPIENGFYMCIPNHCNMFSVGTEVHYLCSKHYTAKPGTENIQTCQQGGQWSEANPVCLKESDVTPTSNSIDLTSSTMTVVIVTSCTVLGLLFVVLLVVIIQRRNHPRRRHYVQHVQGLPAPHHHHLHPGCESVQEARVIPTLDEHDRVALIAFADGVQVVLPSYDEAVRGAGCRNQPQGGRLQRYNSDSSRGSGRSGSTRGDYRPLPTLPYNLRQAAYLRELPNDQRDHHRNSIITTASSAIRGGDNLSLTFGSMDTVNISDNTSTTVTLGTYDSGASNPSLALSQRGVTGSLASSNSNPSLATEEAPLIEQFEPMSIHRSQTASPSIPEVEEAQVEEIPHK